MKIRAIIEYEVAPKGFVNDTIPDSILIDERDWLLRLLEVDFARFTYMSNLKIKTEKVQ